MKKLLDIKPVSVDVKKWLKPSTTIFEKLVFYIRHELTSQLGTVSLSEGHITTKPNICIREL